MPKNLGRFLPLLIWTKSKRTATFFRKPSLKYQPLQTSPTEIVWIFCTGIPFPLKLLTKYEPYLDIAFTDWIACDQKTNTNSCFGKNGSTVLKEFDITVFLLSGIFYANRVIWALFKSLKIFKPEFVQTSTEFVWKYYL